MKKNKYFYTVLTVLLTLTVFLPANLRVFAQDIPNLPSGLPVSDLEKQIDAFVAEHQDSLAGMSVSVFDADQVLFEKHYGFSDIANQIKVDEETAFEWGSATKLMVWVSAMQLYEKGLLDLNADITQYLPENFLTRLKDKQPITMIDLMNHQAGFQEVILTLFTEDISQVKDLESALRNTQPGQIYEVGKVTAYSNWGAALAGFIVEQVSGKSFLDYATENIFEKLGMEKTALWPDLSDNPWIQSRRPNTKCYSTEVKAIDPCQFFIPLYPAGMATGTLSDFRLFAQAIDPQGESWHKLFSRESTINTFFDATSTYPESGIPRIAHGMLISLYSLPVYGHGGNTAGQTSNLLIEPQSGISMVVMANQSSEQTFAVEMPEIVFGKLNPSDYNLENRVIPKGFFTSLRTIAVGPFSIMKNLNLIAMEEDDINALWDLSNVDGKEVLHISAQDLVRPNYLELGLTLFLALMLVVGGLYSLIVLIIGIFRNKPVQTTAADVVAQHAEDLKIKKWKTGALLLVLLALLNTLLLVWAGLSFMPKNFFYVIIAIYIVLLVLSVLHLMQLIRMKPANTKNTRRQIGFPTFLLIVTIISIVFFQFYQFWNL